MTKLRCMRSTYQTVDLKARLLITWFVFRVYDGHKCNGQYGSVNNEHKWRTAGERDLAIKVFKEQWHTLPPAEAQEGEKK